MSGQNQIYITEEQRKIRSFLQRCRGRKRYYEEQYRKYDMLEQYYKHQLKQQFGITYGRTKPKSTNTIGRGKKK